MVLLERGVRVPLGTGAVVELDEPDPALHQPTRQQAVAAEGGGLLFVHAVEGAGFFGLAGEVHGLGSLGLHPEGQLVALDPGVELGLIGTRLGMALVEPADVVELGPLPLGVDPLGIGQVRDRFGPPMQTGRLVRRPA